MWPMANVNLNTGLIPASDATRQHHTAEEILYRLRDQPGVILADEVGMGKTYIALAVAASAVRATNKQVVVMVPPSVKEKWPQEWQVFKARCLKDDGQMRATPS